MMHLLVSRRIHFFAGPRRQLQHRLAQLKAVAPPVRCTWKSSFSYGRFVDFNGFRKCPRRHWSALTTYQHPSDLTMSHRRPRRRCVDGSTLMETK